ncbi:MAG: NAD(P)H-hydrate dehydratase [Bryobacteraceae bacterium]|nr:NAD(P)H-hydrate dehydratase [Bryobacteraceae bacterium]
MQVLTAAEMRLVDERTGIPGDILMENAAHRVVECMRQRFGRLSAHRVRVYVGKGNNGGDGLAIARLLAVVDQAQVDVVLAAEPLEQQWRMLAATGAQLGFTGQPTLVVDALLGTGITGAARGRVAELIAEINSLAVPVVAVDLPSGMNSDAPDQVGAIVRADLTVTFTAPKPAHVLPPNCDRLGESHVCQIGSPASLLASSLHLSGPPVLPRRPRDAHKGNFGHVLVVGGAKGKTGAAEMAGMAALRGGAGWVSVHSEAASLPPELMTAADLADLSKYTVLAVGPGLGMDRRALEWYASAPQPMVMDADALNLLATVAIPLAPALRVLTPHPGEMRRLQPDSTGDRVVNARSFAVLHQVVLVLKGQRTLIAFPDGHVYVNPTGTPAMAKAGSGDILTGLIASLLAQHPAQAKEAILAAVWLHGKAGGCAERHLTEHCVIATDLLTYLPEAYRDLLDA